MLTLSSLNERKASFGKCVIRLFSKLSELSVSLTPSKTLGEMLCNRFLSRLRAVKECKVANWAESNSRSRFWAKSRNAREERPVIASGIELILVPVETN